MDDSHPLPTWLRQALIGLGLFLLGGLLAFGYSYRPLHGALTWKVEQLEERLDERNLENLKLSQELATLRSAKADAVDPESFAQVESELKKTRSTLAQIEKDLARADRKRKDANASARTWRKRYEKLRDEQSAIAAKPAPAPEVAPTAPAAPGTSLDETTTAPAAPATTTAPSTPSEGPGTLPTDAGGPAAP